MRPSCRLGQSHAATAAECPRDGIVQRCEMSRGDEQRLDVRACADDCPDDPSAVSQLCPTSSAGAWGLVLAAQAALCDADRRQAQQQPDVARQPQPARVRQPLSVAHQQIGPAGQFSHSGDNRGRFAKAQQAGHVRERTHSPRRGSGDRFHRVGVAQHRGRHNPPSGVTERAISPRHGPNVPGDGFVAHKPGKATLQRYCLRRRDVPTMSQHGVRHGRRPMKTSY